MSREDVELVQQWLVEHLSQEGFRRLAKGSGPIDRTLLPDDVVIENFD
jgi:hypothetical protein